MSVTLWLVLALVDGLRIATKSMMGCAIYGLLNEVVGDTLVRNI